MKQIFLFLILASLTLACKKKNEDPTIFEGKVVYVEDGSPAASFNIMFTPKLKSPPLTGSKSGESKHVTIGEDGKFKIEFPYNKEVIFFGAKVDLKQSDGSFIIFTKGNGLDCSPYDCEDFKPHQNYSNLVIKIPRP